MNHISALNVGVINSARSASDETGRGKTGRTKAAGKTIIVTGVARSGTSLIAALLKAADVFMGEFLYDVVNEDAHMLELLRSRDRTLLKQLIRQRNGKHASWGFKIPNLNAYLKPDDLSLFRNPHLVIVCRDPVAVAVRNALSEHYSEMEAMFNATTAMQALSYFVQRTQCPVLLLSYEKALSFPNTVIDSLMGFCQVEIDEFKRGELFLQIKPNRTEYLLAATRHFAGRIDGLLDGQLYGWCFQDRRIEPVAVDVFADDGLLGTVRADAFREDLADQGAGSGCHGFFLDLGPFGLRPNAVIRARVNGRTIELDNSGKRLSALDARVSA
jgi:hypothetical protein